MTPKNTAAQAANPDPIPKLDGEGRLKILVVDDHDTHRKVIEIMLQARANLITVDNGQKAVEAAQADAFDLILMDMQMPVMDGLSATRHIRAHEMATQGKRTSILLLSAHDSDEYLDIGREAGADGYLSKPVSMADLLVAVEEATKQNTL